MIKYANSRKLLMKKSLGYQSATDVHKMKILYIHQYFNTPSMHGGTRSYEFARKLASKGHQVTVVTSWREDAPPKAAPPQSDWGKNKNHMDSHCLF